MMIVNVLIDLPSKKFDTGFTYNIPEKFYNQIELGKRVVVDFNKRLTEGYIISVNPEPILADTKPVLLILDEKPLFDANLYRLAKWVADYYLCPLAKALSAMIPSYLTKTRSKFVYPIRGELPNHNPHGITLKKHVDFLSQLYKNNGLSLAKALKSIDIDALKGLQKENLIYIGRKIPVVLSEPRDYIYVLGDFDIDANMPELEKKAPRQAEIMAVLVKCEKMAGKGLEQKYHISSIRALVKKGYLTVLYPHKVKQPVKIPQLTDEQQNAVEDIEKALCKGRKAQFLLHGITGSGKTEVYLRSATRAIKLGRKVLVLVPEIALTRHLIDTFSKRIDRFAVLHSDLPLKERYLTWQKIKDGEIDLVLGTRSAVFAPFGNLGLIIIDEEQEITYKQEQTPKYHASAVALKRAELESAVVIFGSATPSLETYHKALAGNAQLLELTRRIGKAKIPLIDVQDMKTCSHKSIISPLLQQRMKNTLENGEQCILFINRRGYSPITVCIKCGNIATCPYCSVGMTYHQDIGQNVCHYCNYRTKMPIKCSNCGSNQMQQMGYGTQRVEKQARELFPQSRIQRLDMDTSRRKNAQTEILDKMKNGQIDILIGTQMVAKGFDFPAVSLVGIIDADSMLNLPDFRAGERGFQLMVQAAGRAGRGDLPGQVIIQTYSPQDAVIQMALKQDFIGFYLEEIQGRRLLNYPPFTNLLRFVIVSPREREAQAIADSLRAEIDEIIDAKEDDIEILGPAPCPLSKIRNRFRYQLFAKCKSINLLNSIGKYIINAGLSYSPHLDIEINPLMTM